MREGNIVTLDDAVRVLIRGERQLLFRVEHVGWWGGDEVLLSSVALGREYTVLAHRRFVKSLEEIK